MNAPVVHFITHPDVVIDASVAVTEWPLSNVGVRRMQLAVGQTWLAGVTSIFSSAERKAQETARILAEKCQVGVVVIDGLGENDRSATGYLPRHEFEALADLFFGRPAESARGWERAVEAQRRIVGAVEQAIAAAAGPGDIAIISHGGVGALLLCHLKGVPISREEDQPGSGGGNTYAFDLVSRQLRSGWRSIEGERKP